MGKNDTYELLSYKKFILKMKEKVEKIIGSNYIVNINHVIKNNSIELDGIVILCGNEKVSPNIYLNSYYERYLNGETIDNLANEIVLIYKNSKEIEERESINFQYEFENMRNCIIYRIINFAKNVKLLNDIPHIRLLDLAITFHCLIRNNDEGIGTIRITNEHIKNWNIGISQLKEMARLNTPILFPVVIKSMSDVIVDIMKKELNNNDDDVLDECKINKTNDMYVITNTKGINGASCLLYPHIIKEFAEELDTDFYILPSSIHELILVKVDHSISKQSLVEMVNEVNRNQVPEEEILSNSVYYYSRERDALTL